MTQNCRQAILFHVFYFIIQSVTSMKKLLYCLVLMLISASAAYAQRNVTGKVVDQKGEPLIGATILVEGTSSGTVCDTDGSFTLNVPANGNTLVVSYTGFITQRLSLGSANDYSIVLEADVISFADVVVVGYGTRSKKELTGSVSKVSADAISKLPVTGLDQALQGQAPGVQVTAASGTPGASVSVRVRGPSSISAGNQPLYVVDGVPINIGSYSQLGFGGQQDNALSNINPSDIESIEVLKDAAAAAIYGSRASNGVVLITTKRGKQQKTEVSLNTYYGTQDVWRTLEPLTGPEYGALVNEARAARSLSALFPDPATLPNTNWQDEIFRSAPIQSTDLSFSGGSDRTKFYVSGSYFDQDGIIIGSSFDRLSVRINLDNLVSDRFKIGTSTSFSNSNSTRLNNDNNIFGVLSTAVLLGTHIPVYNADGTYGRDPNSSVENPVAAANEPTNDIQQGRLLSSVYGELELAPWLSFRTDFSLDYLNVREFRFSPTTTNAGAGVRGQGIEAYARDINVINENYFSIRKSFGDNHNFDAVFGVSFQHSNQETFFAQGENYPGNTIQTLNAASVKKDATSNRTEWGLNSYFARLNYGFAQKYLISASVRADGSSRFGANNRFGIFPAVSAAWRISEEGFLKDSRLISDLKLRASWGLRGNQNIGNFASRALISAGANYNQLAGLAPTQLGNPDLTWEQREDIDIALEVGLFDDRLSLVLEAYQGTTNELLLGRPLVFTSGFATINENIGSIKNTGIDIGINSVNIEKDNFSWTTSFNLSFFENEILKLAGAPFAAGFASWVEEGYALGSFRGYEVVGIFQTQEEITALDAIAKERSGNANAVFQSSLTRPGDIQFRDLDGDGIITSADQKILGHANPQFYGGLTNNLSFYGFDLSFFFQFTYGNKIYNNTASFAEGMNSVFGQIATVRDRWTPENTDTDIPRAVWADPNNNRRVSDRFLEDGSYLRLKNVTLGYNLPSSLLQQLRLSKLRFYVSGQNLLTFTDYSGFDPEVSTFGETNTAPGTDFLTFPQSRTILFGLNVAF